MGSGNATWSDQAYWYVVNDEDFDYAVDLMNRKARRRLVLLKVLKVECYLSPTYRRQR